MAHSSPRVHAFAAITAVVAAVLLLRLAPPAGQWFYPLCPLHELTGLLCPGCGATRAAAALVAGHWSEAFHHNALFVLLSPCAMMYATLQMYSALRWNRWRSAEVPAIALVLLCVAAAVFAVARNVNTVWV